MLPSVDKGRCEQDWGNSKTYGNSPLKKKKKPSWGKDRLWHGETSHKESSEDKVVKECWLTARGKDEGPEERMKQPGKLDVQMKIVCILVTE